MTADPLGTFTVRRIPAQKRMVAKKLNSIKAELQRRHAAGDTSFSKGYVLLVGPHYTDVTASQIRLLDRSIGSLSL